MTYDFLLFENTRNTDNHYKDLEILAHMLQSLGYSVAIADVFLEGSMCKDQRIPHVTLNTKCPKGLELKYKRRNGLHSLIHRHKLNCYLKKVIKEVLPLANNFYVGSLFTSMPTGCIDLFPIEKKCFVWGLRSVVLKQRPGLSLSNYYSYQLYKTVLKRPNICFVVSNELIGEEFVNLGIDEKRIVLRPERTIPKLPEFVKREDNELHLLSIGSIRPKRKVEQCINALSKLRDETVFYTIAGKSNSEEREQQIEKAMEGVPNVERRNYRLSDEEYLQLMNWCDVLVLCDDNYSNTASSGTMNEALLNNKPIIASDCPSFKYYIDKYHIGIAYEWENIDSLIEAIRTAKKKGVESFRDSLMAYQRNLLESKVLEDFGDKLNRMITNA